MSLPCCCCIVVVTSPSPPCCGLAIDGPSPSSLQAGSHSPSSPSLLAWPSPYRVIFVVMAWPGLCSPCYPAAATALSPLLLAWPSSCCCTVIVTCPPLCVVGWPSMAPPHRHCGLAWPLLPLLPCCAVVITSPPLCVVGWPLMAPPHHHRHSPSSPLPLVWPSPHHVIFVIVAWPGLCSPCSSAAAIVDGSLLLLLHHCHCHWCGLHHAVVTTP